MRVVKEITHPECKISIFSWNNRYIIKIEQGTLEQTFKVDALDVADEGELIKLIDAEFLQQALNRFRLMGQSLYEALDRTQS
jgi:hypothetical protein